MASTEETSELEGIAVVGLAGRFPGARDVDEYWANLCAGVESVSFFSDEELLAAGVSAAEFSRADYVRAGSEVEGVDLFDAEFFGYTAREAQIMDPQQRLFLETAWGALEHAGYDSARYPGRIGVFGGTSTSSAYLTNVFTNMAAGAGIGEENVGLGTEVCFATSRVAYKLGLTGPAITVQTACSTALVAVHMACQSLLNYECDMALSGAAAFKSQPGTGYHATGDSVVSPDGHCRPFDAGARGTVFGSGVGAVVLKRLSDAVADNDTVYAVIKGSAVNNDGDFKASFTAPSVGGQAAVVSEALGVAGVDAGSVGFVEAHGTGTVLGDPIEVRALTRAFRESGAVGDGFCWLGSVKSNFGHLDAAAGVAGLIKAVLCVRHGVVPPTLHFESPNPDIDFESSPFRVVRELVSWGGDGGPRRAGVSAFGFGGTNAHVVLEQAPEVVAGGGAAGDGAAGEGVEVVVLSARSESALEVLSDRVAGFLRSSDLGSLNSVVSGSVGLGDVAFTLGCGRRGFPFRRVVVGDGCGDVAGVLESRDGVRLVDGRVGGGVPGVVFVLSGQGSQYAGMGRELYEVESVFRGVVDECAGVLLPLLGVDVREFMFAEEGSVEAGELISRTDIAQPALFVLEYGLVRLWESWGVVPSGLVGHSLGELVAACVSGVFSLVDALGLVVVRGRLMQGMSSGAMVSVGAERSVVESLLLPGLSLAAHNGPRECVVSGSVELVERFVGLVGERGVAVRPVAGSWGFHSVLVDEVVDEWVAAVAGVERGVPRVPFVSNVTGLWVGEEVCDPEYWGRHARGCVEFWAGVDVAVGEGDVVVEVGPGQVLAGVVRRGVGDRVRLVTSCLPHRLDRRGAVECVRRAVGQLWSVGVEVDWAGFYQGRGRGRVGLPSYPFERKRFWLDPQTSQAPPQRSRFPEFPVEHPLLEEVLVHTMGEMVFRTGFRIDRHWVLGEHRLVGEAIVPGTTYLEMARGAAETYTGAAVTEITDVDFFVPLLVPEDATREVHTKIMELPDGRLSFSVVSHDPDAGAGQQWTEHARGLVGTAPLGAPPVRDPDRLRERCALTSVDVERRQTEHSAMTFGRRWREGMRVVHVGRQAALGVLELPGQLAAQDTGYVLHPALLDLATGISGLAVLGEDAVERAAIAGPELYLPVGYDRLTVYGPIPAHALAFATAHPGAPQTDQVRKIDVVICAEDGTVAVEVQGFTAKRVADPRQTARRLRKHARHHTLRWIPAASPSHPPTEAAGTVLVVHDNEQLAASLLAELRAGDRRVVEARLGDRTEALAPDRFLVDSTADGYQRLLDEQPDHVVFLAGAADPAATRDCDVLDTTLERGLHSVFSLAKVLAEQQHRVTALTVIAPSVALVDAGDGEPAPAHAALFGLTKVVGLELQGVRTRCVDVDADTPAEVLAAEVLADRVPRHVAFRHARRYVPELFALPADETVLPQPDGTYLITGGLGGLGLEVAKHLARERPGVRLALLGRTGPGQERQSAALREMAAAGAVVRCYQGDVSDLADMRRVIADMRADLGRIGCVVHAAGVAGDGFLMHKDDKRFRETLAPKVFGTTVLDIVTEDDPPELMVLFGSTAGILGAPGQSDYTAANMYLDGFGEYRDADGRRTVTVDWTDWLDVGMAADHGVQPDQGFFRSVGVEDGLRSFAEAVTSGHRRVIVGEVNHEALRAMEADELHRMTNGAPVVLSAAIQRLIGAARRGAQNAAKPVSVEDAGTVGTDGTVPAVHLVGRADGDYSPTERVIAEIWARELGLVELNVHESSFDLGGNSLIALRIAQSVERALGARMRMADLFRYVTVAELAEFVDSRICAG